MNVTDAASATALPLYADNFTNNNGCAESDTRPNLPAGGILTVSSSVFDYDPSGHELRAVIRLCADTGQRGTCTTQSINFTP